MRRRSRCQSAQQHGQAAVELALTVVLLAGLMLGLVEVSRWFHALNAIQNAAREAARYASTGQPSKSQCTGDYLDCRVEAIANMAYSRARMALSMGSPILLEECPQPLFSASCKQAGGLIVAVRGNQCLDDKPECDPPADQEFPGVAGGRVQITLRYNHPVLNPLLSFWLPTLPVMGSYEIVNEPWKGMEPVAPAPVDISPDFPTLDSDGDGWTDDDERWVYGTSPATDDTDGDGHFEGDGTKTPLDGWPLDPCKPDPGSPTCL